jgi:DNA-damage-inducible protein D
MLSGAVLVVHLETSGWLGMRDIHERKRLKSKEHVLDHMGCTELAGNLFRDRQTEEKLRRENVRNKSQANRIHSEVGRKVRRTIHELGGTMPENLPVTESIKKVAGREKKRLKAEQKKLFRNEPGSKTPLKLAGADSARP